MQLGNRVRSALALLLLTVLSGCSKSEVGKPSAAKREVAPGRPSARAELPRPTPSASVRAQAADAMPTPAAVPASWPEVTTLASVGAEELRGWMRTRKKKGTLVNAWASWCGPCREELPMLASIAKNLAAQSIDVVLVSVDEPDDRYKAEAFLKSFDIALPAFLAARPLGDFKVGLNPRWPGMLPASFLFDGTGKLRYFWGGEAFEHEIVAVIDGFLAGKPIDGESDFALAPGKNSP